MNRIQIGPLLTLEPPQRPQATPPRLAPPTPRATAQPVLFRPMHYEAKYRYPLIVWLHTDDGSPEELLDVMPEISLRNFAGVAPAGQRRPAVQATSRRGFDWSQSAKGISTATERVAEAIDYAQLKMNIAPNRIFVAGYGAGGTMALRVGFEMSNLLAGAISLNGPLPDGMTPLRDWVNCRRIPLFCSHGRHSVEFDEARMCDQLKLLHCAGFQVTLRQYPTGDELATNTLRDVNRWVMETISTAVA